jgi:hypothetical protein
MDSSFLFNLAWATLVAAVPFFRWMVKRYIDRTIQHRFDQLKKEHEIRFGWQHKEFSRAATEIHQAFVESLNTLRAVAASGYKIDTGPTQGDIVALIKSVSEFQRVASKDTWLLPKELRTHIDLAMGRFTFAYNAVLQADTFLRSDDTETMSKAMSNAAAFANELAEIGSKIEDDLRDHLMRNDW